MYKRILNKTVLGDCLDFNGMKTHCVSNVVTKRSPAPDNDVVCQIK